MTKKIVIPLNQVPEIVDKIYNNIVAGGKRAGRKGMRQAGNMHVRLARKLAPYQDGHVQEGLSGERKGKYQYSVKSTVTNEFPHNRWVDNDPKILGTRAKVRYPHVQRTGIAGGGFFTRARKETAKKFPEFVFEEVKRIEPL